MTTISVSAPLTTASVEGLLQTLLERFETLRMDQPKAMRVPMQAEIRSLDFWRSIVAECLATFFLIFIICGAAIPWAGHTPPPFAIALAAGFAIASLTLCFSHVSGPFIICQLILQLRPRSLSNSLWDDGGNFFCSPPARYEGEHFINSFRSIIRWSIFVSAQPRPQDDARFNRILLYCHV